MMMEKAHSRPRAWVRIVVAVVVSRDAAFFQEIWRLRPVSTVPSAIEMKRFRNKIPIDCCEKTIGKKWRRRRKRVVTLHNCCDCVQACDCVRAAVVVGFSSGKKRNGLVSRRRYWIGAQFIIVARKEIFFISFCHPCSCLLLLHVKVELGERRRRRRRDVVVVVAERSTRGEERSECKYWTLHSAASRSCRAAAAAVTIHRLFELRRQSSIFTSSEPLSIEHSPMLPCAALLFEFKGETIGNIRHSYRP